MKISNQQVTYSPTDLVIFSQSPFASWLQRFSLEFPDKAPKKDIDEDFNVLLQKRGYIHEDALESDFIAQGLQVVHIQKDNGEQATLDAMRNGVDVIAQAKLTQEQFSGYADFLVKQPGKSDLGDYYYEVWDTKLSRSVKPSYLLQLCCYTEMIKPLQSFMPVNVCVVLGNGNKEYFRVDDYFAYYSSLKSKFLEEQLYFNADQMPDPADSASHGNWAGFAETLLLERDHLCQIATITKAQIKKLQRAGIHTAQKFAEEAPKYIKGINPSVLERLVGQAQIQKKSVGLSKPAFKILKSKVGEKQGLAMLPPHNCHDVFFDIEGFPLDEGGLEYLWGNTYFDRPLKGQDRGVRKFKDFWAHNPKQEKQCFKEFIDWVYKRWQEEPKMHIYHYANYEIAACRKLMGRYGVCEYELDQLLRNDVFVDCYKIVKSGLLLGEPRYSIKNVENLYRGKRETDVGNGGDSIVVYEQWRELNAAGEQGDTWQTSTILKDIRDYNVDDCNSTQELVDWLREQQREYNIDYLVSAETLEPELKEEVTATINLREAILNAADMLRDINGKNQTVEIIKKAQEKAALYENLAWSLEFHRRENKPVYWRLFDRLGQTEEELLSDLDCLAICTRTVREPITIKRSRGYEYSFDANQEFKGSANGYILLGIEDENANQLRVSIDKEYSDLKNGLVVVKTTKNNLPSIMTLVPFDLVDPFPIPQAIFATVKNLFEQLEANKMPKNALLDFLTRQEPNIKGCDPSTAIVPDNATDKLSHIIKAVVSLNNSTLCIQGPPGSGKSYTGKHVIAELMKRGKRVGICSNSHKAIDNLLKGCMEQCAKGGIKMTAIKAVSNSKPLDTALEAFGVIPVSNNEIAESLHDSIIVATTAWGFAREDLKDQLDYLFIDEAGQVSVANLIGISHCSKNIVLLGDQMQLGQPIQGTHPAESGLSILDYFLHDSPTIPDHMGVFLGTTYRMHPAVNQYISTHFYDNKLHADATNVKQRITVPSGYSGALNKEAGIQFLALSHQGNTQASEEEAQYISELTLQLLGRTFTNKQGEKKAINWEHILYVAPYNHQARTLANALAQLAGGINAKVASVDKFQGQEAPIVFLSMCTSDANESPRGIDFLFDRHRLNVAISRAQCLVIVVGEPSLFNTTINRVEQMTKVNAFCGLEKYIQCDKSRFSG